MTIFEVYWRWYHEEIQLGC